MLCRVLAVCLLAMLSGVASATPLARILDVSVDIVVDQASTELEIIAPETDFSVLYQAVHQRFDTLNIPFQVRSVDGSPHNYTLSLAQLSGVCRIKESAANILSLSTKLDGVAFELGTPSAVYATESQQKHSLELVFPRVVQISDSQSCDGSIGLIAAVNI